jgi:DNA-binding NtrC family response regulator
MRERNLIVDDNCVERRLLDQSVRVDQSVRGFGYEPALPLLGDSGHVRALADIEAEAIRFAISHYRGQMSEVARRLHIGRSTLYRKLDSLGLDAELSGTKAPAL